jgi:hypothetical protein
MTYNFKIWNGKNWVSEFSSRNSQEINEIKKALEEGGFDVLIVPQGLLPLRTAPDLEDNIIKALMESN